MTGLLFVIWLSIHSLEKVASKAKKKKKKVINTNPTLISPVYCHHKIGENFLTKGKQMIQNSQQSKHKNKKTYSKHCFNHICSKNDYFKKHYLKS